MQKKVHNEIKVVFFDLDNTLFDNLKTRHDAIIPALNRLDLNAGIEDLLLNYEQVVDLSDTFEFLGLTNFKHFWNRSELYAILTILFTKNPVHLKEMGMTRSLQKSFLHKIQELNKFVINMKREYPFNEKQWNSLFDSYRKDTIFNKFLILLKEIEGEKIFKNACEDFEKKLEFKLCDGVLDLVETFVRQDIKVFVITEGYTHIQKEKIKKLKLDNFFVDKILTTEDASNPRGKKKLVNQIKIFNNKKRKGEINHFEKVKYDGLQYYLNILETFSDKSNPQFYSRVIHSIKKDLKNPEKAMRNLAHIPDDQWRNGKRIKLAMIGDRYDKDLRPLISLLGSENVITIRIKQAKHKNTFPSKEIDKKLKPSFTTSNFQDIENFLFNTAIWQRTNFIQKPNLINKCNFKINKDHFELARNSNMWLLKRLCNIIESESRLT